MTQPDADTRAAARDDARLHARLDAVCEEGRAFYERFGSRGVAVLEESVREARAAGALAPFRIDEADAPILADRAPPAWLFLHGPRSSLSSTAIRQQRGELSQ